MNLKYNALISEEKNLSKDFPTSKELLKSINFLKESDNEFQKNPNEDKEKIYFFLMDQNESNSFQEEKENSCINIFLSKNFITKTSKVNGRLDIYARAHLINNFPGLKNSKNSKNSEPEIFKIFKKMEETIFEYINLAEKEKFTKEIFDDYINKIGEGIKNRNYNNNILSNLKKSLKLFQNVNDEKSLKFMEEILIKLMGHPDIEFRDEAIRLLNVLYDETDWQENHGFSPRIISIGEELKMEFLIRKSDYEENSLALILNSPTFNFKENSNTIKWLKPKIISFNELENFHMRISDEKEQESKSPENSYAQLNHDNDNNENLDTYSILKNSSFYKNNEIEEILKNKNLLIVSFSSNSKIVKSGYYDYRLVKFKNGNFQTLKNIISPKLTEEFSQASGRFIAIDKSIKDFTVHEVFADLTNAEIDKEKGKIIRRGKFSDIEKKLQEFSERSINCLYLMGALERDNQIIIDDDTNEILDVNNSEASPMAVTCRASISKFLGGENDFNSLIKTAKNLSMKIIIDSLTRISSSRPHRKYRKILLNTLDKNGKMTICYGSDGHSVNYEDSALLNYRKIESWDLLIDDTLKLAEKYNIDGIHMDNCQTWPQIFETDFEEMLRIDSDGEFAYSSEEIVNGDIVYNNKAEDCGYWSSELIDEYPNPFLVKLTKSVWKKNPKFLFIGEAWGSKKSTNRHIILSKSGIVPRMYTLPRALSSVFGRRIHRNGYIEKCTPEPVSIIRDWLDENNAFLPEGAITIQGSSGQVWPYPALLYGRGNWTAVDLLFTLPDVPMTFMDEIEGEAYRVKITSVYSSYEMPRKSLSIGKSKSLMKLDSLKGRNSSTHNLTMKRSGSLGNIASEKNEVEKESLVQTECSISDLSENELKNIKEKQNTIVKELGPEFGFDLNKIKFHYNHRRKMRISHESLRNGKLVYLNAFDTNNNIHNNVFAFSRISEKETGIIIINFHSQQVKIFFAFNS